MNIRPCARSSPVTSTTVFRITKWKVSKRSIAGPMKAPSSAGPAMVRGGAVTVSRWITASGRNTSASSAHSRRVTMSA